MSTAINHSRERVHFAYDKFLTACAITTRPRNRAYALGVLTGTLQAELLSVQLYLKGYSIPRELRERIEAHVTRLEVVLDACSKVYINNEV